MTISDPAHPLAFSQWEVWQARWEHEDGTIKDRPVLILSSTARAASENEVWVAKFTKTFFDRVARIKFTKGDPSFAATGLTDTCYLYICQARKIPKSNFIRKRGKLLPFSAAMIGVMIKQTLKFDLE